MTTLVVHSHFRALEFIEFLPYGSFVFRRQPGPRFVRASIIVVRLRHLDVVVEAYDLLVLELLDRRPEAELSQQESFLLLFLLLLLGGRSS